MYMYRSVVTEGCKVLCEWLHILCACVHTEHEEMYSFCAKSKQHALVSTSPPTVTQLHNGWFAVVVRRQLHNWTGNVTTVHTNTHVIKRNLYLTWSGSDV